MSQYPVDNRVWAGVSAAFRGEGIWEQLRLVGYYPRHTAAIETQLTWLLYLDRTGGLPAGAMYRLLAALQTNLEEGIAPDSMLTDFIELLARQPAERSQQARLLPWVPDIASLASLDRVNGTVLAIMQNALAELSAPTSPAIAPIPLEAA